MKKILTRWGGVLACAVAISFAACSNSEFDGRTDTVYSLETPSVSAKAYPGVNIVSWKPVTGASSYKVYVYEEGAQKGNAWNVTTSNFITDTDLKNGKNYTYYVEAVSTTNPATVEREVYATNSRGEASVKAIVPPDNTKSLELPAYESGYDGTNVKTVPESDQWVVKPGNIKAEVLNDKVYVSFPMKAYLKYNVKYYNNDLPHDKNVNNGTSVTNYYGSVEVISDANANDVVGKVSFDITGAGKHQIAVVAKAYGGYADSDEVVREELVTIDALKFDTDDDGNVLGTKDASADYIFDDYKFVTGANKTARISFTPAKKNGEFVPTSWYKVYRRVNGEYENTEVTKDAAVVKTASTTDDVYDGTTYYVDDKDLDVTKEYTYTIVVTDGKKYGKAETASLSHKSQEEIESISISDDSDEAEDNGNKITWTVTATGTASTATLTAKYLVVQEGERNEDVPVRAEDFKAGLTLTPQTGATNTTKSYAAEAPAPAITGSKATVYLLVTATKEGYETTNIIKSVELEKLP